jgi:multiple sugar transport system substrate-binding protein
MSGHRLHNPMRRRLLVGGALALSAPSLLTRTSLAQSGAFNWRRFAGQSIEVSLVRNPRSELLLRHQREFEELTGMRVGSEAVPEQQHRQKVIIEFNSGRTSFDVTALSLHVNKRMVGRGRWLEDMRPLLADPQLVPPDYDVPDLAARGVAYATQSDGRMDSLPNNGDYWMIYWNKELFQAKGVQYPRDYDELMAAAQRLHDPANGVAGMVGRGLRNANVPLWTQLLLGWGQETVAGNPPDLITDTADAIAAGAMYQKLLRDFGPQGVAGFNWNEAQALFMQGRAAMWIDGIGFAPPVEDRARSRVAGKVGYGVFPQGPKARHSAMFGDALGISRFSEKKQQAFFYCLWATSKIMSNRLLQGGGGAPFRESVYRNEENLAALRVPREWAECLAQSMRMARPGLPEIVPVTEFRDSFGVALTNMIGGADPAGELRRVTAEFRPVLQRSEQS